MNKKVNTYRLWPFRLTVLIAGPDETGWVFEAETVFSLPAGILLPFLLAKLRHRLRRWLWHLGMEEVCHETDQV